MTEETQPALESVPKPAPQALENAQLIPISFLEPNPHQPRTDHSDEDLDELATSIRDVGVLEPLLVVRRGRKRYTVIAGHRRMVAATKAQLTAVPCIVRELGKDEFLMFSMIENLQRADLTAMEEAQALRQLIDQFGWTYRDAAAKIGKSPTYINDRLALLDLPADIKKALMEGSLSLKKALELGKIPNERLRARLYKKAGAGTLEDLKRMIEEEIERIKKGRKKYEKTDILPELREFARNTEGVRIFKNRINIKFNSPEELQGMLANLLELLRQSADLES